jgi:hypothetical protein
MGVVAAQPAVDVGKPERRDGHALHLAHGVVIANPLALGQRTVVIGIARELERLRLAFSHERLRLPGYRFAGQSVAASIIGTARHAESGEDCNEDENTRGLGHRDLRKNAREDKEADD